MRNLFTTSDYSVCNITWTIFYLQWNKNKWELLNEQKSLEIGCQFGAIYWEIYHALYIGWTLKMSLFLATIPYSILELGQIINV